MPPSAALGNGLSPANISSTHPVSATHIHNMSDSYSASPVFTPAMDPIPPPGFLLWLQHRLQRPTPPLFRSKPSLRLLTARGDQCIHSQGVHTGAYCWPFLVPAPPGLHHQPLGSCTQKSGKWTLIMHLSFPPGHSINDGISFDDFPLCYSTVSDAMDSAMLLGRGAILAKVDVKSAYRLCPVRPDEQHLLGMKWKGSFFFDRVLPFGLRTAPYIFNCLADALEWIARQHGIQHIRHYLDDLFLASPPGSPYCERQLHILTSLCSHLGIPLAEDKLEGPTTQLEYLGILLDTEALEARLSPAKVTEFRTALTFWTDRASCLKRKLLSLLGTLSFTSKIVPAGCTFLRRMITLSTTADGLNDTIPLSHDFCLDLHW